jgi:hypothetical protein
MHGPIQIDAARTLANANPRWAFEPRRHPEGDRCRVLRWRLRRRHRIRFRLLFPQRSGARSDVVRPGASSTVCLTQNLDVPRTF